MEYENKLDINYIKNIEKNAVRDYLYINKNIDFLEDVPLQFRNKVLLGLYGIYSKFDKITTSDNRVNKLDGYENNIYMVDGKVLSDKERILLELFRINKKVSNNSGEYGNVIGMISSINELLKQDDRVFLEFIPYIKKKIVSLQILLDMDVTFYNAGYDYFSDFIRNTRNEYNMNKKRM